MNLKDDGVGLPEDLYLRHPSSLGLPIVDVLIGELGGAIDLWCGGGIEISITILANQS